MMELLRGLLIWSAAYAVGLSATSLRGWVFAMSLAIAADLGDRK